ncbi:MAG: hypothetical protein ACC700_15145 [Anaerolineales bacterium]
MKSRIAMVTSVLALTGLALAGSACGPAGEAYLGAMATERSALIAATESPEGTGVLGGDIKVMYEVTGDANGVTITLLNDTGGIDQGNYVLPFRYMGSFPNDTSVFSISARIIDPTWGTPEVTCRIATYTMAFRPGLKVETKTEPVVVAATSKPPSVGDFITEFGPGLEVETKTKTKVTAVAAGPGNIATCLWENADN